jgi:hypothetical protein
MSLHGLYSEEELGCDLGVGPALRDEPVVAGRCRTEVNCNPNCNPSCTRARKLARRLRITSLLRV